MGWSRGAAGEESARVHARARHSPSTRSLPSFLLDSGKMEGPSQLLLRALFLCFELLGMEPRAAGIMLAKCLPGAPFPSSPVFTKRRETASSLEKATPHGSGPVLA